MQQLLQIRNGRKVQSTFSVAEMQSRLDTLRAYMASEDIDVVLMTSYHNINYYADFLYCAFGRPYGLVISHDDSVSLSANIDGGQPWRRTFGDNLVYTDWQRDSYFVAVKQLVASGAKRVAVEFDHINLVNFEKLQSALPDCEFR